MGGKDIVRISPSGSQTTVASGVSTTGLAVDGAGNLLVGDGVTNQVLMISPWGSRVTLASNFLPGALAVDGPTVLSWPRHLRKLRGPYPAPIHKRRGAELENDTTRASWNSPDRVRYIVWV